MANVEVAKPTQVYSASLVFTAASSATLTSSATNQLFAGVSNILGYTITSGSTSGTVVGIISASSGVSTLTVTLSSSSTITIQVYWSNTAPNGLLPL